MQFAFKFQQLNMIVLFFNIKRYFETKQKQDNQRYQKRIDRLFHLVPDLQATYKITYLYSQYFYLIEMLTFLRKSHNRYANMYRN